MAVDGEKAQLTRKFTVLQYRRAHLEFNHKYAAFPIFTFETNESARRSPPGPLASSRLAAHKLVIVR